MFRALKCPSSGGQILLSQHLVSSLCVQPFTESDDTRCCDNTICPPEDGHVNARKSQDCNVTYILLMNKNIKKEDFEFHISYLLS